jgi:hypothetical protein
MLVGKSGDAKTTKAAVDHKVLHRTDVWASANIEPSKDFPLGAKKLRVPAP